MGAPDNELIAEVNLVTEGFTQARDLASKIVSLFKLSRQLLSPQQHYDWGLRALKVPDTAILSFHYFIVPISDLYSSELL